MMQQVLQRTIAFAIVTFARVVTGVRALWVGCGPTEQQRIYFANHSSHGDFVLLWSALPPSLRATTRPVAGGDYWQANALRRFVGQDVFQAVLIDREFKRSGTSNPVAVMQAVLDQGGSLILFPEGTRNIGTDRLLPFKSGLYHLARACPRAELVPAWIANLNRVMPKGEFVPVPLLCTVSFGQPIKLLDDEKQADFLARARQALLQLAPEED